MNTIFSRFCEKYSIMEIKFFLKGQSTWNIELSALGCLMKFVINFMSIKIYRKSDIGNKSGGKQQIQIKFLIVERRKKSKKSFPYPICCLFKIKNLSTNWRTTDRSMHYSTLYVRTFCVIPKILR